MVLLWIHETVTMVTMMVVVMSRKSIMLEGN